MKMGRCGVVFPLKIKLDKAKEQEKQYRKDGAGKRVCSICLCLCICGNIMISDNLYS